MIQVQVCVEKRTWLSSCSQMCIIKPLPGSEWPSISQQWPHMLTQASLIHDCFLLMWTVARHSPFVSDLTLWHWKRTWREPFLWKQLPGLWGASAVAAGSWIAKLKISRIQVKRYFCVAASRRVNVRRLTPWTVEQQVFICVPDYYSMCLWAQTENYMLRLKWMMTCIESC